MGKDIFLTLEVFVGEGNLTVGNIKNKKEILLKDEDVFITVNKIPYYKGKLKTDKEVSVVKVVKILSPRESDKIKEKYQLEVL